MSLRFQTLAGAVFALALLAGPIYVRPIQGAEPAAKDTAKSWTLPRTSDGQPDFQGYWNNGTYIPVERPAALGDKEFYTEAEAAAFEQKRLQQDRSQAATDVHYDNLIWQGEKYTKGSANLRTSIVFDPPNGRLPPLSPEGQKRAAELTVLHRDWEAAVSAQSRTVAERCITFGADGPPMLGSTYNANFQILQNGASVVILSEMIHAVRTIPLDGRPHLPAAIRQLGGDSRGHWEGDTLVVDTTNFSDKTNFRGPPATTRQDIFSGPRMHVVERFTRINDGTIVYRFTVDDPDTWSRPWSGETLLRKFAGPIFEYACHEGNYGLVDILAGARAAEKKAGSQNPER